MNENIKYILAVVALVLAGLSYGAYKYYEETSSYNIKPATTEVHVHSDFLFVINGTKVDLTGPEFQSHSEQILHKSLHFHDGVDTMIHRHADDVTFGDFLSSLGFSLTDSCVTTNTEESFCTDQSKTLTLLVNGTNVTEIGNYIPQEGDKILLYYGDTPSQLSTLQSQITNDACLYSGTCPERGEPPFESCGLTCEI